MWVYRYGGGSNPEHPRDTAKEVAKAIREGYAIERVSCDFVREHWLCPTHEAEKLKRDVMERLTEKQMTLEEGK